MQLLLLYIRVCISITGVTEAVLRVQGVKLSHFQELCLGKNYCDTETMQYDTNWDIRYKAIYCANTTLYDYGMHSSMMQNEPIRCQFTRWSLDDTLNAFHGIKSHCLSTTCTHIVCDRILPLTRNRLRTAELVVNDL